MNGYKLVQTESQNKNGVAKMKNTETLQHWNTAPDKACRVEVGDVLTIESKGTPGQLRGVVVKTYSHGRFYVVPFATYGGWRPEKLKMWGRYNTNKGYYVKEGDWFHYDYSMDHVRYDYPPTERVRLTVIDGVPRDVTPYKSQWTHVDCFTSHEAVFVLLNNEYGAVEVQSDETFDVTDESRNKALKRCHARCQMSKLKDSECFGGRYKGLEEIYE